MEFDNGFDGIDALQMIMRDDLSQETKELMYQAFQIGANYNNYHVIPNTDSIVFELDEILIGIDNEKVASRVQQFIESPLEDQEAILHDAIESGALVPSDITDSDEVCDAINELENDYAYSLISYLNQGHED